jgi:hypothetical protein
MESLQVISRGILDYHIDRAVNILYTFCGAKFGFYPRHLGNISVLAGILRDREQRRRIFRPDE